MPHDLERLKWLDPLSKIRFTRRRPARAESASSEALLANIVELADDVFASLTVFEQSAEATSRGARARPAARLDLPEVTAMLARARDELWEAFRLLEDRRGELVDRQKQGLALPDPATGLRLHLGAGRHELAGWINVDAGGGDLAINLDWGLPFADGSAAFVYCAHVLEHLRFNDQAPSFAAEICRVLGKGGVARLVVPDIRKLITAYASRDVAYFDARSRYYPLSDGFLDGGIATLDYILLFCGASAQVLNLNHKFGYDVTTLSRLLLDAGFSDVRECAFQASPHEALRIDEAGENALARTADGEHFSLFVEATK